MLSELKNRIKDESGFMGLTHSLSALTLYLLIIVLLPELILKNMLHNSPIVLFGSLVVVAGAALLPDLDNTRSTALSVMGFIGQILSTVMRSISVAVYMVSRGKLDDDSPNPHRGFWHTIVASFVVGLIVFLTTKITYQVTFLDRKMTIGFLFAVFWIFICSELALAALFSSFAKKIKKEPLFGPILIILFGLSVSLAILFLAPSTIDYSWISWAMTIGYILHIIGDTFTVSGTPILWPLNHKGKRWWSYRLAKIHAGSAFELTVIAPLFALTTIALLVKVVFLL